MTLYQFKMRARASRDDPYYVTTSGPYVPITVIAENRRAAFVAAEMALGPAGNHRHWRFAVDQIIDARLAGEDSPA
jgi:hypothetical protein